MIGDVQCWLLKPLPWGHLDFGRCKNQKVKVRCMMYNQQKKFIPGGKDA